MESRVAASKLLDLKFTSNGKLYLRNLKKVLAGPTTSLIVFFGSLALPLELEPEETNPANL